MRKRTVPVLLAGFVAAAPVSTAMAADVTIRSETIARGYERDSATESNLVALPLYEYLSVAYEDPEESGISLHAGGWGRKNLGDEAVFADNETGELLYGYLDLRRGSLLARVGRQDIFSGPASEAIDGARIAYRRGGYDLTGFAGLPVALEGDGMDGDYVWGGRMAFSPTAEIYAAVSYKYVESDGHRDSEDAAADIRWDLPRGMTFTGRSTYSLKSRGFSEHDLELAVPLKGNDLRAGFERISYEDFFAADDKTAAPFRYLEDSGGSLNIFRTTISRGSEELEAGAALRYYDHSDASRDSFYGGVTVSWHGDGLTQTGVEAGRMESDDSRNSFTLLRVFTYFDQLEPEILPVSLSADLVYALYDEKINNEDYSLFISAGAGAKLMEEALEVRVSIDYSVDPYYSHDMTSMISATWTWQKNGEGEE